MTQTYMTSQKVGEEGEMTRHQRQCHSKSKGLNIPGGGLESLRDSGTELDQKESTGVEELFLSCAPPEIHIEPAVYCSPLQEI